MRRQVKQMVLTPGVAKNVVSVITERSELVYAAVSKLVVQSMDHIELSESVVVGGRPGKARPGVSNGI